MIKAVIFDMDGVLIDSEPIHLNYLQGLFKSIGVDISNESYSKFIGTTSHYMWNILKNEYDLKDTVDELVHTARTGFFNYLSSPQVTIKPINGIPELIDYYYTNNLKMAVASSSPLRMIEFVVESFNIKKYFNEIVTGDYVHKSKPEPDIFLYAAEKLGVEPEECIVIEDSTNGIKAAKRAGMKCIAYVNINSGNQDLSEADVIIDSFLDLVCLSLSK